VDRFEIGNQSGNHEIVIHIAAQDPANWPVQLGRRQAIETKQ
jgi:hypothetical protein